MKHWDDGAKSDPAFSTPKMGFWGWVVAAILVGFLVLDCGG